MTLRVAFLPRYKQLADGTNPYFLNLRSDLANLSIEVIDSPNVNLSWHWLWGNRKNVDVIHLHFIQNFYAYNSQYARFRWVIRFARNMLLARLLGYLTVFTLHNLTPTYPLKPTWVDYLGHWVVVNISTRVIVHCDYAREKIHEVYGRKSGVFVLNHPNYVGLYPNHIPRSHARLKLGLDPSHIVFGFIGGIRPNKGVELLIRSFIKLDGANYRLVIAGKPWPPSEYISKLEHLAAQDERILLFLGQIPDENIQIFLNAVDIVVLPFSWILTSGSTLLAMSFSQPVIVPAMGCLPELVTTDCGWLYPPDQPEALLKTMQLAVQSDTRSMGAAAYQRVQAYTHESLARKTLAVYLGKSY